MNPKISIIIPCYNSEVTLAKTLVSAVQQIFRDWEVIIINDGSTDETENIALSWSKRDKRIKYYSKANEGLGKARNFGISKALGTYILPLDSDNLLEPDFVKNAIDHFESNDQTGVVHGHAEYFGERTGIWKIDNFNLEKILISNYIDACAIFKKDLWTKVGGYDEHMPYQGNEDWEFWIALGNLGTYFHHLNEVTFKYFVNSQSMIRSFTDSMHFSNRDYITKKYSALYYDFFVKKSRQLDDLEIQSQALRKKFDNDLKSEKFLINNLTKNILGVELFKMK